MVKVLVCIRLDDRRVYEHVIHCETERRGGVFGIRTDPGEDGNGSPWDIYIINYSSNV